MIIDFIILVIIVISIFLGRHKGLTVCLVNFFSLIIAVIISLMVYKPVGNYFIKDTKIGANIKQVIKENIPMNEGEIATIDEESNLPEGLKKYINEQAQGVNIAKDEAIENISNELSSQIIYLLSFIGVFIIVRSILLLVKILSRIINKLPILKQIDHIGGAIVGAIEGIIIIYFAFAVISTISPVLEGTKLLEQIEHSFVGKTMYNHNIVMSKIKNLK